jgi:Mg/Co/Ni transporter MgtE
MLGAAHKPGAMPLRPLGLGDIYDAAFRIIRFNPKSTVGAAVLVAAIAMAIPVLVTAVLTSVLDLSGDALGDDSADLVGTGAVYVTTVVGSLLPLLLRRLGFDPATSSAPFVATLVDVTGLVIYFSVALVTLRGTLL